MTAATPMVGIGACLVMAACWLWLGHPRARLSVLGEPPGAVGPRLRPAGGLRRLIGRAPVRSPVVGAQLPPALDLLATCLLAGVSMRAAVETVAAVSPQATALLLDKVAGQLRLGRAPSDAWLSLADDPWWGEVAKDVARSATSGTSLVKGLRIHASEARRELETAQLRRARTVGVRSVLPLMACYLPAFVLVGVVPIIAGLLARFLG